MNISGTETSFLVTLERHSHPCTHAHTRSGTYKSVINSQVKAQILPLLKEIVQDEFADEVGVEGIVDNFSPTKLEDSKKTFQCTKMLLKSFLIKLVKLKETVSIVIEL